MGEQMQNLYYIFKRVIIAIDLKSFFAACECVERNLDPFTTPLVVCDPTRNGAITLAVTPYLKKLGIPGRTRAYLLPPNIKIIKAKPRMSLYIKKSEEVIKVYLEFVAEEDLHVYSIDEVFLDVTDYLSLYQKTAEELALTILTKIKEKTGLIAAAGIGPNLLLAKIALDLEAKKMPNNLASWTYDDIPNKLWPITPLSNMWGIGHALEKKLNALGLFKVGDLAQYPQARLKDKFGIMGEELWYHANGIDLSRIRDLKKEPKEKSINHSQVLYQDYDAHNIPLIIEEMIETMTKRLRSMEKQCLIIGFGISYSKSTGSGFYHSLKLPTPTKSPKTIYQTCMNIFDQYYDQLPIRKVSITLGNLVNDDYLQLNLFESLEEINNYNQIFATIDLIKTKYGKNSVIKASSLLKDSTAIMRNQKIGGHHE